MNNPMLSTNMFNLVEQCVFKSLFYLSETMQYYWPAAKNGKGYLQEIAENNIALHLARAFSENNFLVWAEIPFKNIQPEKTELLKLDFLAYHYSLDILVALELKNTIETPQNNLYDLHRLLQIHKQGVLNEEHYFNNQSIGLTRTPDIFGIVTILNATEFATWWRYPTQNDNIPQGRTAQDYRKIAKALEVSGYRAVMPLCEYLAPQEKDLQYRFSRAAYALYGADDMDKLEKVLK